MCFKRLAIAILLLSLFASCTEDQRAWLGRFFKVGVGGNAVPVAVEQVAVQERQGYIVTPATLQPSEQVEVRLPFEAHVERVFANIGEAVKAGAVLCKLSDEDINLRLASLRAEQREVLSNLERSQYFLRNRDRLLEEGRIDRTQYDNLDAEVTTGESTAEKLRTQITQTETQVGNLTVTSPIVGIVQSKSAAPGLVIPEKQPLFVITKVDPINIVFALAPYEAKTVRTGMQVTVRFRELPGESVTAAVTSVGTSINQDTGRFDVVAQIANPAGAYKVGMGAQVEFAGAETQKYFMVPAEAVITDNRRHYVFTVANGLAHKVPVVVREIKNDYAEIIEGLVERDLVIVKGNKQLKEGTVVDIWGR